jgi:hypothetical protein
MCAAIKLILILLALVDTLTNALDLSSAPLRFNFAGNYTASGTVNQTLSALPADVFITGPITIYNSVAQQSYRIVAALDIFGDYLTLPNITFVLTLTPIFAPGTPRYIGVNLLNSTYCSALNWTYAEQIAGYSYLRQLGLVHVDDHVRLRYFGLALDAGSQDVWIAVEMFTEPHPPYYPRIFDFSQVAPNYGPFAFQDIGRIVIDDLDRSDPGPTPFAVHPACLPFL